ncbi:MAG: hypothetical protein JXB50_00380 [Spirochaetes bacterium]|nr:hypothetical protein [Spirochaetota bacterium]
MKGRIKKISNISILFILIIFLSINCMIAEDEKEEYGNAFIITPKSVPLNKLIAGMTTEEALKLNGSVRYEVIVENNGNRINSVILKSDDSAEISIPAGINLDIGLGIFLAANGTNDELINAYLVTDLKKNIVAIPNQTIYIDFILDFNRPTIVDYYYRNFPNVPYPNAPGMADITGAVIYNHAPVNDPIFTAKRLTDGYFNILTFNTFNPFNTSIGSEAYGSVFKVDDPDGYNGQAYWYIDKLNSDFLYDYGNINVIAGLDSINFIDNRSLPYKNSSQIFLKDVHMLESIKYVSTSEFYYYFFIYKYGMLTLRSIDTGLAAPTWTSVTNVDFRKFESIHPDLPFLLDIERDPEYDGRDTFFASKIGLFYVNYQTLDAFAEDRYDDAMNGLKRLIRIPDPYDTRKSVVITSVKVMDNYIYLGSRYGLYRINKLSKAWVSFSSKLWNGPFVTLDINTIERVKSFRNNPIIALETGGVDGNILAVTATKSVFFKNVVTGRERELTVWDGLPFIPTRKLVYRPDFNTIDFYNHGPSPVRFILWDGNAARNRFWIATKHGLASIDSAELF